MTPLLMTAVLLDCWDDVRVVVPGQSDAFVCREGCDAWSLGHVRALTRHPLWAVQLFSGSEAGAERALAAAEDRLPIGAYWLQGHPGRAQQDGVERQRVRDGRVVFRAIGGVYVSRRAAREAALLLGTPAWIHRVR